MTLELPDLVDKQVFWATVTDDGLELSISFTDGTVLVVQPKCSFCDDMWLEWSITEEAET